METSSISLLKVLFFSQIAGKGENNQITTFWCVNSLRYKIDEFSKFIFDWFFEPFVCCTFCKKSNGWNTLLTIKNLANEKIIAILQLQCPIGVSVNIAQMCLEENFLFLDTF